MTSHVDSQQESWTGLSGRAVCLRRNCSPSPQSTPSALSLSRTLFPQRSSFWFPFGEQLPSHDLRSSWSTSSGQLGVLQGHPCCVRTPPMNVSGTRTLYMRRELLRLRVQLVQAWTHCFRHFLVLHERAIPGKGTSVLTFTRQVKKLRELLSR